MVRSEVLPVPAPAPAETAAAPEAVGLLEGSGPSELRAVRRAGVLDATARLARRRARRRVVLVAVR